MQCDICLRTGGHKLPFLCPTDARNILYEPRIENARILLENDALDQQITAITSPKKITDPSGQASEANLRENRTCWDVEVAQTERDISIDRTQQIIAHADKLRLKIEGARQEVAHKKTIIARRKSELSSATNGLDSRRAKQLEEIDKKIKMTKYKWNQLHGLTAQSRAFLCVETASLYGLRRHRVQDVWEYTIAGVSIIDLRAMNNASAVQITTSLAHIAHLLVLSAHYLSLRLPAEITLPHRDYPQPTIMSLSSSYIYTNIPFPGSTPVQSSSNSPSASRYVEPIKLPRPRPLFITKALPHLAKEDPTAYSFFLEGATLLAYNVAWVCKTQGVPLGKSHPTSFEDICALGRNLFNVLIGTTPRPPPGSRATSASSTPVSTATSTPTKLKSKPKDALESGESGSDETRKGGGNNIGSAVGHFSHGTAHTFLGSTEGNDFMNSFKLMSPRQLVDNLRLLLLNEVSSAEWEILDQDAWAENDGRDLEDDGVMVGARRVSEEGAGGVLGGGLGRFGGAVQSFMSMGTVMDAIEVVGGGDTARDRKPGTSGWTKLKSR
jgi:Vacuolar sorting 38 and autophagy-related subunit 14